MLTDSFCGLKHQNEVKAQSMWQHMGQYKSFWMCEIGVSSVWTAVCWTFPEENLKSPHLYSFLAGFEALQLRARHTFLLKSSYNIELKVSPHFLPVKMRQSDLSRGFHFVL